MLDITKKALTTMAALLILAGSAAAQEYVSYNGQQVINGNGLFPANEALLEVGWATRPEHTHLVCLVTTKALGVTVSPGTVSLTGGILDVSGAQLVGIPEKSRPFSPNARFSWALPDFTADHEFIELILTGEISSNQIISQVTTQCRAQSRTPCSTDATTGCLMRKGRFKVRVLDDDFSPLPRTDQTLRSASFAVDGGAADLVVTIKNDCKNSDHFTVRRETETETDHLVVIEDTQTGQERSWMNTGVGTVTDAAGFATCP